jgi:Calcineurin-like phosphoesterase
MRFAAFLAAFFGIVVPAQAPPPTPDRAVVWAVGDGADGSAAAKKLAARIAKDKPDRFIYIGDVYPSGTAADFRRNYATTYGRLRKITEPTPGNHEWGNRRTGYLPYWRKVKGHAQRSYYSFGLAGWRFLDLNSETAHGKGSAQLAWLRKQLAPPGTCRIAFWHRPRFSAGTVHGDSPDTAPLWNALRGHARLVVNGHDHTMQRLRKRNGLTEYVSGAGGIQLYRNRKDSRLRFGRAGVTGALRMVLEPGKATLEFRSSSGKLLDRSRATCRP